MVSIGASSDPSADSRGALIRANLFDADTESLQPISFLPGGGGEGGGGEGGGGGRGGRLYHPSKLYNSARCSLLQCHESQLAAAGPILNVDDDDNNDDDANKGGVFRVEGTMTGLGSLRRMFRGC